jgi:hypothetical protein
VVKATQVVKGTEVVPCSEARGPSGATMYKHADLIEAQQKILSLRKTAEELKQSTGDFPALARNTARILASIKMLELNLSDVVEAGLSD